VDVRGEQGRISWTDLLEVDGGIIDEDHRALIDIVNKFLAVRSNATKAELLNTLDDLEHYSRLHFWRENELQRRIGYPETIHQRKQHASLLSVLEGVTQQVRHADDPDMAAVVSKVEGLLRQWLVDHILKSDRHMRAYREALASSAFGLKPLAGQASERTITLGWRTRFAIDNGMIDDDHKRLIEIINAFVMASANGHEPSAYLADILDELRHYAMLHFGREQKLQMLVGFSFSDAHAKEHKDLLRRLVNMTEQVKATGGNECDHRDLAVLLKDWLTEHVAEHDTLMRPYLDQAGKAVWEAQLLPPPKIWR
jgi:hemerythrin